MMLRQLSFTLLLCATSLLVSCGDLGGPSTRPNVLLISIDSLRFDHLGCYGYERDTSPFIDELATQGVRFENAVSTTSWTLPAHAAMFTGLNDSTHGLVDNGLRLSNDHLTLAELLKSQGYKTAGFFGAPYLHPTFGLGQGFDVYQSCMGEVAEDGAVVRKSARSNAAPSHSDVTGPRTAKFVKEWAATVTEADSWFCFLHLWDVHYDFIAPEEYVDLFDPNYKGEIDGRLMSNASINARMSPRDLKHVQAQYDAEIRFTDDILRGVFEDLEARGMLENTLVILTADHGEEFFEHGGKGHNQTLFDEVVRVPLIVVWPGEIDSGGVVKEQVQIIDFMPTVANAARCEGRLTVQGRDLGPLLAGQSMPTREALLELLIDRGSQRALRSNDWKLIRPVDTGPAYWFDLAKDPGERRAFGPDVGSDAAEADARLDATRRLKEAIARQQRMAEILSRRDPEAIEIPAELLEELRGLGYIGEKE